MFKKLLALFIGIGMLLSTTSPLYAQSGEWWRPEIKEFINKVGTDTSKGGSSPSEIFGERYTLAQVNWIVASIVSLLGQDVIQCASDNADSVITCLDTALQSNNFKLGPVLAVAGAIDGMQGTRMASGVDYVAQKLDKLSPIPTAYAQTTGGYGFTKSLLPVQKLWVASRNGAYALITIAMVVLAFMIMFRAKLDPRTTLTIQAAIPKIVIALLFITFSYAIAGFLVDLGFLMQVLVAAVIVASGNISGDSAVQIFKQMNSVHSSMLSFSISFLLETFSTAGGVYSRLASSLLGSNTQGFVQLMGGVAIDALIALIVMLLLLIAFLRIFWLTLKTQVVILMLVIAGPFFALMGLINPASSPISSWMKSIVANLMVLITVGIMIFFAHAMFFGTGNGQGIIAIVSEHATNIISDNMIDPFNIENFAGEEGDAGQFPSGLGSNDIRDIGYFISLVLMLAIPGIANNIRSLIQTGRTTPFDFKGDAMSILNKPAQRIGQDYMGRAGKAADEYIRTGLSSMSTRTARPARQILPPGNLPPIPRPR